ncbi:hypothetical protein [Janthinobacterium sp. RB2P8]|jgi:hypothetical protein|uniref:hypothetical protein n=1 Tax=Janthinobacterium sp. RB2P8 TaxID=3424191 RepID=UPI003F2508E0
MNDYIICMHDDTQASACTGQAGAATLVRLSTVQAESIDDAKKFLLGNPVLNAGGTVEIRELPRN